MHRWTTVPFRWTFPLQIPHSCANDTLSLLGPVTCRSGHSFPTPSQIQGKTTVRKAVLQILNLSQHSFCVSHEDSASRWNSKFKSGHPVSPQPGSAFSPPNPVVITSPSPSQGKLTFQTKSGPERRLQGSYLTHKGAEPAALSAVHHAYQCVSGRLHTPGESCNQNRLNVGAAPPLLSPR